LGKVVVMNERRGGLSVQKMLFVRQILGINYMA